MNGSNQILHMVRLFLSEAVPPIPPVSVDVLSSLLLTWSSWAPSIIHIPQLPLLLLPPPLNTSRGPPLWAANRSQQAGPLAETCCICCSYRPSWILTKVNMNTRGTESPNFQKSLTSQAGTVIGKRLAIAVTQVHLSEPDGFQKELWLRPALSLIMP